MRNFLTSKCNVLKCLIGLDKNSYHHEKFVRGHPELARQIPRESIKGSGAHRGAARTLGSNPNLYELPFLHEDGASSSAQLLLTTSPVPLSAIVPRTENEGLRTTQNRTMMLHLQRLLLQERQRQQQMMQNLLLAPTVESGYLNVIRALDTLRTTQQGRITGLLLNEPSVATIRNRALAMALRQNVMHNL
jgi:hypothetical protein